MACGWALFLVQFVTLEWTPDCGGLSFGMPLPFATAWMGSSQAFDVYVGPLLLNAVSYGTALALPAYGAVRFTARLTKGRRRLLRGVALLPWGAALLIGALWSGLGVSARFWPGGKLYVHAWRTKHLYLGIPYWGDHLERQCD